MFLLCERQVKDNMTDKQRKFADEYLKDCNATRSYLAAYPNITNEHSARTLASRLLAKVDIKTYIDEQLEKISSEKIADAKEVMEYLTSVLRSESRSSEIVVEGIGDGCSKASVMEKPPSEKEKLKAAELLGKRYGIFTENINLEVEPVVIMNDLTE